MKNLGMLLMIVGCVTAAVSLVLTIVLNVLLRRGKRFLGYQTALRPGFEHILSFAVPAGRFLKMVGNMDESFLITQSSAKVRRRIKHIWERRQR